MAGGGGGIIVQRVVIDVYEVISPGGDPADKIDVCVPYSGVQISNDHPGALKISCPGRDNFDPVQIRISRELC